MIGPTIPDLQSALGELAALSAHSGPAETVSPSDRPSEQAPPRDDIHVYALARTASGSLFMGHVSHSSHSSHSSGLSHYSHASHASHSSHASHVSGGPTVHIPGSGGGSGSSGGAGGTASGSTSSSGRPDLRINKPGGSLIGNDVYGSAIGQQVAQAGQRGRKLSYWISVQNDAKVSDQFRLSGSKSSQGITVKYFTAKGANVTKRVTAGTFQTTRLGAGASYRLKVVVTVTRHAAVGNSFTGTVKAVSHKSPSHTDAVGFVASVI